MAARGLDIPAVEHVIHYQVPKDPDVSSTPASRGGVVAFIPFMISHTEQYVEAL